ncbi:hypothetical protein ACFL5Q_04085 [Planctomycetota bacterium]
MATDLRCPQCKQPVTEVGKFWVCPEHGPVQPQVGPATAATSADREARIELSRKVLKWLDDEPRVYERVHALQNALCFEEDDVVEVAEFAENRSAKTRTQPQAMERQFPEFLKAFLSRWAHELATSCWREYTAENEAGAPWFPADDFGVLTRFLCDYLCANDVFSGLSARLLDVVQPNVRDERDRRHAQREYVRMILNDYVLNPGPSDAPLELVPADDRDFGLMDSFVRRWQGRLPLALASAAGAHLNFPPRQP